ncbi:jg26040 [Pararge aegeria aegeria]|uniref:Jg26040 protein n=1 Tax=Pararge aegeria aegeria TaxID=348720 RepID=A0A8S4R2I2_9NEOP|nr:jg26040 [Pararge aegeria aegeria]
MATVLEDVKEIINTPWYLSREESENPLNLTVKSDLYPLLSDLIKLEGDASPKYELQSTSELLKYIEDIPAAPTSIVYPPELIKDVRQLNKRNPTEENIKQQTFIKEIPKYRSSKAGWRNGQRPFFLRPIPWVRFPQLAK